MNFKDHKWIETEDGSKTLYSEIYSESCHSISGAIAETKKHYIEGCKIAQLFTSENSTILEVGLGLGIGLMETLNVLSQFPNHNLQYISLEIQHELIEYVKELLPRKWQVTKYSDYTIHSDGLITLIEGDARISLKSFIHIRPEIKIDAIYQDAFSPKRNVDLWTKEWFSLLYKHSSDRCLMSTYSSSKAMRKSMIEAGWHLSEGSSFGTKRSSTIAAKTGQTDQNILEQLKRSPVDAISDQNRLEYAKNLKE